jgi:hypothetical protein
MDIHKPKPWHGLREFLKEYLIIVIGVLTALAAEQLAEQLRWQRAVEEARASIHQEIAFNGGFFAERARGRPCVAEVLGRLDSAISAAEATGHSEAVPGLPTALSAQISDAQWQAARAAQVLPHFPRAELDDLGRYYDVVETLKINFMGHEGEDWLWLKDLKDGPHKLDTSDLALLRFHLRSATALNGVIGNISQDLLDRGEKFGVKPVPRKLESLDRLCAASAAP